MNNYESSNEVEPTTPVEATTPVEPTTPVEATTPVEPIPSNTIPPKTCSRCGAELKEDQTFCQVCGQKVEQQPAPTYGQNPANDPTVNPFDPTANPYDSVAGVKSKNKKVIILGAAAAAVLAVVIAIIVISNVFFSVEALCEKGEYLKAYEKAEVGEKMQVLQENAVLIESYEFCEAIKSKFSSEIQDAYIAIQYDPKEKRIYKQLVLSAAVTSKDTDETTYHYALFTADENGKWKNLGVCSSLHQSKDDDDYLTSVLCNVIVEKDDCVKLNGKTIDMINERIKDPKTKKIKFIPNNKIDTDILPVSKSDDDDE